MNFRDERLMVLVFMQTRRGPRIAQRRHKASWLGVITEDHCGESTAVFLKVTHRNCCPSN